MKEQVQPGGSHLPATLVAHMLGRRPELAVRKKNVESVCGSSAVHTGMHKQRPETCALHPTRSRRARHPHEGAPAEPYMQHSLKMAGDHGQLACRGCADRVKGLAPNVPNAKTLRHRD